MQTWRRDKRRRKSEAEDTHDKTYTVFSITAKINLLSFFSQRETNKKTLFNTASE
jgi:hypothetical protein